MPTLANGSVYAVGKRIHRIDQETGKELASRLLTDKPGWWLGPVSSAGKRIIACHVSGLVVCLSPELDRVNWRVTLRPMPGITHVGVLTGNLFVVAIRNKVYGLHIGSGRKVWEFDCDGEVHMTPATDGKHVFFGTFKGRFYALDIEKGEPLWRYEGQAKFGWTNPVIKDGIIYVGDRGMGSGARREDTGKRTDEVKGVRSGALNAFNAKTGRLIWGRIFGATGLSRPFVGRDKIWVGRGVSVLTMRRKTGELLTDRTIKTGRNPFGTPQVIGQDLIFGNLDGHLYVHDVGTGKLRWALQVPGQVLGFVREGTKLYVSSTAGVLAIANALGPNTLEPGTILKLDK